MNEPNSRHDVEKKNDFFSRESDRKHNKTPDNTGP